MTRLLSPEIVAFVMLASIFAIRPFFRDFQEGLYGQTVDPGYVQRAIGVGIVGMAAFLLGCAFTRRVDTPIVAHQRILAMGGLRIMIITVMGVVSYVAILTALVGPASVAAMAGGRSSEVVTAGVPAIVMMLPMSGSIAAMMYIISRRKIARATISAVLLPVVAAAVSVGMLSQLGNRRFIIPAILMPVIAAFVTRRVPLRPQYLLAGVVGLLVIAIIPMVRSSGSRRPGESLIDSILRYANEQGFVGIVRPIFASNDTEMLDYIAVVMQRIDAGLQPWGFGAGTVGDFLTASIPSSLFPKSSFSDEILTRIWGGGCGKPACPVASIVGVSYFDAGLVGVVIFSLLFGLLLRRYSFRLRDIDKISDWAASSVIIITSYAIVLTRTNIINAIWWVIYATLIAFVIYLFSSRRIRGSDLKQSGGQRTMRQISSNAGATP